ncbi:putative alpha,alpha-trehalose-phosphate synthase [UDP-forming] 7 [Gracilariopsis chorda]|uniref:Putative alpha,alpha-trehalose-phosphate synthase [UDP-forming] 7 n=1 Tax=Gracilariopsis chorda TaxID=448386 RepID=A0A2V3J4C8_9FLOR|nr:putative alpha,alpha-trehalose-phosphate synthase [UDP-forming] 7 [Gracilariopsis chorda]QOX06482.1 trehalose-6-phosphate synthase 1 [Gracilariopsis lemaneiformis]|eukprot:PXF48847.1 putative alpha,alpha-trehalose-phosphate synthase [UDP-forming] 7 [Gracilariopsis chorda]
MVRISAEETRVTFVVHCETQFGQRLRLVGDHEDLGGGDPVRGIELTTSVREFPTWRISLTLPANRTYNYKYYCVPGATPDPTLEDAVRDLSVHGQEDYPPNDTLPIPEPFEERRVIQTIPASTMLVDEGQFGILNNDDPNRIRTTPRSIHSISPKPEDSLDDAKYSASISSSSAEPDSVIIALYRLPIIAERDANGHWSFAWDDDALYLTSTGLRRGLEQRNIKPLWVGILNSSEPVPLSDRDHISSTLLEKFSCVPVFLTADVMRKFYQGFCKNVLWPAFHMINNASDTNRKTKRFDDTTWYAYQRVNRMFSQKIVEHYDGHLIWVHDYHLMLLPYYLRIKISGVRVGFYLHIPWPSSEIFRMLPVRNELLKGLLSSSMLGFHLFDYARHFLSCCVRLLNLEHEAKRGNLGIEYEGRHVTIRVSHIGVDPQRFSDTLTMPHVRQRIAEYETRYNSKIVLGAVDDLDVIKGIALKLIAFENYLESASDRVRSRVVLIQVALPKAARVEETVRSEVRELVDRINAKFGTRAHKPVVYIEESISFDERIAIYSVCNAMLITPIRDGLNLIPYEYLVATPHSNGQLILSEFTGCSRALSSAVRVNPWDIHEVRDAIDNVIQNSDSKPGEIFRKHEADRKYVEGHSSVLWCQSFLRDLSEAEEQVQEVVRLGLSRGRGFRRLEFRDFKLLNSRDVVKAFRESRRKLFLFDYDGTLTPIDAETSYLAHKWARPTDDVLRNLNLLAQQENCTVIILSGRGVDAEGFHVPQMQSLGIAAEHGFYYKKPGSTEFETTAPDCDLSWIEIVKNLMQVYTERTDGSYIEEKSAGLVWHYLAADPEFGNWQSKEMHDHVETLMTPFEVQVVNGQGWLQVRLSDVNKGTMVRRILDDLGQTPDFILCCGDDRTDEDMFEVLSKEVAATDSKLFTTTVGVKPSNARYYLRSSGDVALLIENITEIALPGSATHVRSSTLEDMRPLAARSDSRDGPTNNAPASSSGILDSLQPGSLPQSLER